MKQAKNAVVLPRRRLLDLFTQTSVIEHSTISVVAEKTIQMFEDNELLLLRKTQSDKRRTSSNKLGNLKQNLNQTSTNISKFIDDNESFMTMLPEADKARSIFVSSILSPVDLYSRTLTATVTHAGLSTDILGRLSDVITNYVNDPISKQGLALGDSLHTWIGDAMFKKGATPVVIVPKGSIKALCANLDIKAPEIKDNKKLALGFEAMCDITPEFVCNTTVSIGTVAGLETFVDKYPEHIQELSKLKDTLPKHLKTMLDSVKDKLKVSLDVSKIASATEAMNSVPKKIANRVNSVRTIGDVTTFIVTDNETELLETDEPLILRLPTSSVIPVIVPGSPESKLGYFVVVDAQGNPINADVPTSKEQGLAQSQLFKMFEGGNAGAIFNDRDINMRSEVASDVFDILINHILSDSLTKTGITEFNLMNTRELATIIFSKALASTKVSFIFVPSSNLAYYAFAYRNDGTGKTLLEDASTLIALRTACLTAKVVTMVNAATDRRKIEYSLEDGVSTNTEQLNALLERLYVDKHMFRPTHNTANIFRDIAANSLTIVPKNFEGFKEFAVTTETTQNVLGNIDSELEAMLTRMITMYMRVPAEALDSVHEREFSRSIATSNLLFSNDVKLAQTQTCRETIVLVKAAIKNSASIINKLNEIIAEVVDKSVKPEADESPKPISQADTVKRIRDQIINSIVVTLPSPRVAPDKSQMTELSEGIRLIDEVIGSLWPDELLVSDDPKIKAALLAYRQFIKQSKIKEFIANSGNSTVTSITTFDDIDLMEQLREFNQVITNISAMVEGAKSATTIKSENM